MQFSLFDLKDPKITRTDADGDSTDIIDLTTPFVSLDDQKIDFIYTLLEEELDMLDAFGADQQLVLEIGGTEYLLTTNKEGEIQPIDPDTLSALDPEDYLALRIYQNGDDANILWEYAFEMIALSPPSTHDEILISADNPEYAIDATILGYCSRDSDKQEKHAVNWSVDGFGYVTPNFEGESKKSSHQTTLAFMPIAGRTGTVYFQYGSDSSHLIRTANFRVVPGAPAKIEEAEKFGQTAIGGIGSITGKYRILDQHFNKVEDGTPVSIYCEEDLTIISDGETTDGFVNFEIKGEVTPGTKELIVKAGTIEETFTIDIEDVQISIMAPDTIFVDEEILTTITVNCAIAGEDITVEYGATRGKLETNSVVLKTGQSAMVPFYAGDTKGIGKLVAIFGEVVSKKAFNVIYDPSGPSVSNNIVIADQTVNSVEQLTRTDDEGNEERP